MTQLVERWQPRLWTLARVLTNENDAWDITQETWLAVVRGIDRLRNPAGFSTWAYRIVRNKAADRIRQRMRQRSVSEEEPAGSTSSPHTDVSDVHAALATLPAADRELLTLHYLEGMQYEELAEILDIPLGTVKSRLYKARERLRTLMEQDYGRA